MKRHARMTPGFSQTAIADQVGVAHSIVSRWLSCGTFPVVISVSIRDYSLSEHQRAAWEEVEE
jgi:predicted transcriptional regulator